MRRKSNRGNAMVEFVMATVPTLLCLLSVVEISRIMYTYDSMANAVRLTARYVVVHGADCSLGSNSCTLTVSKIAQRMINVNPGLPSTLVTLSLTSTAGTTTCVLNACLSNSTVWPSGTSAQPGNAITVAASAPMHTTLTMFVPGSGTARFDNPNIQASSKQVIQF
jgi:Flp pilus assembly protein TadG